MTGQLFLTVNNCFINLNQAVWWMKRLCYDPLFLYGDGSSPVLPTNLGNGLPRPAGILVASALYPRIYPQGSPS